MSFYVELVKKARKNMLKLTLQQQKEILNIYGAAIDDLSTEAKNAKDKTLTQRWLNDYVKTLKEVKTELAKSVNKSIAESIQKSANYATQVDLQLFGKVKQMADIDLGPHFTDMFSNVPNDVLESILKGDLYRDGKGLSKRVWNISNDFKKDIDYIIKQAIVEKKSSYELAKDLESFVKDPAKREWSWGNVYPNLMSKKVDYNAQRLARTSITHGFREAEYKSAQRNPFVECIHWELSPEHLFRMHGKSDICDDYAAHDEGLDKGNFPKDDVPIGHPQCLCVTWPVEEKSLDEIADDLHDWINGGNNPVLDKWYSKYGDYFANKSI